MKIKEYINRQITRQKFVNVNKIIEETYQKREITKLIYKERKTFLVS